MSHLFVPSYGEKEEQKQENGNKNQIIKKNKGIRGNGVVQKGTTKEGKEKKGRRRQTTNKKENRGEIAVLLVDVQGCFLCVLLF